MMAASISNDAERNGISASSGPARVASLRSTPAWAGRERRPDTVKSLDKAFMVVSEGPAATVLAESPAFAPQVTKVLGAPWLTVTEVRRALRPVPGGVS